MPYEISRLDRSINDNLDRVERDIARANRPRVAMDWGRMASDIFGTPSSNPSDGSEPSDDWDMDDEEMPDEDELEDVDYMDSPPSSYGYSPRRSSRSSRPRHNLERVELEGWDDMDTLDNACARYHQTLEYRIKWIFDREEKEGFIRRQVSPFSVVDFTNKANKQNNSLNTDSRIFYDWKLGGSDFMLRLEKFEQDGNTYLRVHVLDNKNDGKQLCYQDRYWDGNKFYYLNHIWADRS